MATKTAPAIVAMLDAAEAILNESLSRKNKKTCIELAIEAGNLSEHALRFGGQGLSFEVIRLPMSEVDFKRAVSICNKARARRSELEAA